MNSKFTFSSTTNARARSGWMVSAATLILSAGFTSSARADRMDEGLLQAAPNIMKYLQDHNYKNVGVLKFRVKKGATPTFNIGPLNSNMASRLENALVLLNEQEKPLGIIHDASKIAAEKNLPSYMNPVGRQRLFAEQYPLAWGDKKVKVDVFLTGLVSVGEKMKKVDVVIEAFDPSHKSLAPIEKFEVATDRNLLTDLGQSFIVSARGGVAKRDMEITQLDDAAVQDAVLRDESKQSPKQSKDAMVDFEIRYDGQKQDVTEDSSSGGELKVAEPKEGQKVSFALRNTSQERIGVVLMINGKNTINEEEKEAAQCLRWTLDPGERYEIKGFSNTDNDQIKPFTVLSDAASEAVAFTDNIGMIHVHVIRSGMAIGGNKDVDTDDAKAIARKVNLRGLTGYQAKKAGSAGSLPELQARLGKTAGSKVNKRGLIEGGGDTVKDSKLEKVDFPNPQLYMSQAIRYYKPKGT